MKKLLYPDMYVTSVNKISIKRLKQQKIKTLLFDIDNTLAPHYQPEPQDDIIKLMSKLKKEGFNIALVSNGKKTRVNKFNEKLNIPSFHRAGKPFSVAKKATYKLFGTTEKETAIIGDQIFTDVLGGNIAGLYTILIKPITKNDEFVTYIKRGIERIVIKRYLKSKGANK